MTGTHRSLYAILAAFLGFALLLSACGGEAPPAEEEAPTEATEEEAPTEETDTESPTDEEEETPPEDEEGDEEATGSGEEVRQAFGGGPVGGSFQTFANAMALIMQDEYENLDIAAEGTGGSGANLRGVNAGDFEYGIVYAGDAFLGQRGMLPEDDTEYTSVYPAAPLYGAVVHLVVSEESGIESIDDLPGKRIALGNAGSGAALSAERYFTHLELIDQMEVEFLGYSQAAQAMGDGQLDGFWILTAVPNASVTEATTYTDIDMIDVYNPGVEAGFFDEFPFYTERVIPGGTYPGVEEDLPSFQDTAMLVANEEVPPELVYDALDAIFSDDGLDDMRQAHPAAQEMARENGVQGIPVTIHPGAYQYWTEQGAEVPEDLAPEGVEPMDEEAMDGEEPAEGEGEEPAEGEGEEPAEGEGEDGEAMSGEMPEPVAIEEEVRQAFGGGPVGGSFQTFANAMALIMQDEYENLDIAAEGTGGSGANLRGVNAGDFEYGIVYAGDAFLGQRGMLPEDDTEYTSVYPAAPLYGAVVHLVVSEESGIESIDDLPGKRIALGNAGSGAALSAERYFTHLELIDQMEVEFLGYSQAAQAMGDGQLDGFWILTAVPNASVTEATTYTDINMIDVYNPGVEAGFFDEFPFYTERVIPGGTYPGVEEDLPSFQDTAMLVAHEEVPADLVYNALISIFSEEGLDDMRQAHPAAQEMARENGVQGIPVTVHPGAARFWEELGAEVPEDIAP
jgi:hypothetical protein